MYSTTSNPSQNRSRPPSHMFPPLHSTLSYALVRDFAYPVIHPYHYGPPAERSTLPSGQSTPAFETSRRLSDPPNAPWDTSRPQWTAGAWGDDYFPGQQLPQMAYGDGPPYSEDEDLQSPVVKSSRHKKNRSSFPDFSTHHSRGRGRSPGRRHGTEDSNVAIPTNLEGDRGYFAGVNGDGSETYYINEADEMADGPGGELVTYPPDQARHSVLAPNTYHSPRQRDSHFAATLPDRSYNQSLAPEPSPHDTNTPSDQGSFLNDSRYSRDYQFTIASPDEEMHGKAVALFDFARENENELPLVEGQVIWVSYRHGQGWLVAEDPKTRESGLVPEEYVRLLRDIEGGLVSLSGDSNNNDQHSLLSPDTTGSEPASAITPTQADVGSESSVSNSNGNTTTTAAEKHPPTVSTFSTSSKDLNPYPHHLLEKQAGQIPPQVVHYGSQTNTPTVMSPVAGLNTRWGSLSDKAATKEELEEKREEEEEEGEYGDIEESDEDDDDDNEEEERKETKGR